MGLRHAGGPPRRAVGAPRRTCCASCSSRWCFPLSKSCRVVFRMFTDARGQGQPRLERERRDAVGQVLHVETVAVLVRQLVRKTPRELRGGQAWATYDDAYKNREAELKAAVEAQYVL